MSIAKVEPLTNARRCAPVRLPPRRSAWATSESERSCSSPSAAGECSAWSSTSRSERPAARAPGRADRGTEAGAPPDLIGRLWVARANTARLPPAGSSVLPPGTAAPRGQTRARSESRSRPPPTRGRRRPDAGLGSRQRVALELLCAADRELRAAELAAEGVGRDVLRRLERRGLVRLGARAVRRRPATARIGAPAHPVRLDAAQRAAVARIVAGLDGQKAPQRRRSRHACRAASDAARGHRLGTEAHSRRPRRRWRAVAARSYSCPRSG